MHKMSFSFHATLIFLQIYRKSYSQLMEWPVSEAYLMAYAEDNVAYFS